MMVERHPLEPFIPEGARLLMLGSFPPARHRWCMDFFYPNFTNDMWRIMGLCFAGDKNRYVDEQARTFRLDDILTLLRTRGIAIYDTATAVVRTQGTASDKDLQVVEPFRHPRASGGHLGALHLRRPGAAPLPHAEQFEGLSHAGGAQGRLLPRHAVRHLSRHSLAHNT